MPTSQRIPGWQATRLLRTPRDNRVASYLLGASLLALWTWWALADGAFFGTVLLPGGVLLFLVLALTISLARFPIATRGPHAVAFAALVGLAAWTALSLLWTPAQDLAVDYAQRSFVYAAAFAVGLVLATSLRQRMLLSAAPLLIAGALVTAVVLIRIWTAADLHGLVDEDGTLDFPFGYRNANAGFFAMVALGAIALAARPRARRSLEIACLALAASSLSLGVISQSRGSLIGVVAGVLALLAVGPWRGRAAVGLGIVAIPVALVFSELLDPFDSTGIASSSPTQLKQAAFAALAAGLGAALLAVLRRALADRGVTLSLPRPSPRARLIGLAAATIVVGVVLVLLAKGLSGGIDAASSGDAGYGTVEGSRFTYSGGLNRTDFWRVSLLQAADDPITGGGAGSFRARYLLERDAAEEPRNAHSVWLETLGELGGIGLVLLLLGLGAAVAAALRSRRLGPESAALTSVGITVFAVWLGQASVDWSWYFGGLTAPVLALLGSAAAPAALAFELVPGRVRGAAAVGAVVLAVLSVPIFASERLTLNAAQRWRSDLDGAYGALANATNLNPFADVPLLVEAEIARQSGDEMRALEALDEARSREPEDWRNYLIAAKVLLRSDPARALGQINLALLLNPDDEGLQKLRDKLSAPESGAP